LLAKERAVKFVPSPIEARVWDLCAQLASTQDEDKIKRLLPELKAATAEYIQNIRTMAVKTIPRTFGRDRDAA
jgi:hypothetical protein